MMALSEAHGTGPRLVAFMQYVRIAAVVLSASQLTRLLGEGDALALASPPVALGYTLASLAVAAGAGTAWPRACPRAR